MLIYGLQGYRLLFYHVIIENYLTQNESVKVTPSLVQRDFYRIISQIGTITKSPKRRGYSSGRIKGYKKAPRSRHQVIKKAHRPRRGFRARKDGARNEKS